MFRIAYRQFTRPTDSWQSSADHDRTTEKAAWQTCFSHFDKEFHYRIVSVGEQVAPSWRDAVDERERRSPADQHPFWGHAWAGSNVFACETHYLRLVPQADEETSCKVSFYLSPEDAVANRRAEMTLGRYLMRFYGVPNNVTPHKDSCQELSETNIKAIVAEAKARAENGNIKIAMDADTIEKVYCKMNGPSSCMAHPYTAYDTKLPQHPVRMYAAGDLGVAYKTQGGRVTARAVVWPAKKLWGRVFGDEALVYGLRNMGYECIDANNKKKMFWGAKLLRVHLNAAQGFLAPYIDYHGTLTDAGEFLVLDPQGKISTGGANGITGPRPECMRCNDAITQDARVNVQVQAWPRQRITHIWGNHGECRNHFWWCEACRIYFADTVAQFSLRGVGSRLCANCVAKHWHACHFCQDAGNWGGSGTMSDFSFNVNNVPDRGYICHTCLKTHSKELVPCKDYGLFKLPPGETVCPCARCRDERAEVKKQAKLAAAAAPISGLYTQIQNTSGLPWIEVAPGSVRTRR